MSARPLIADPGRKSARRSQRSAYDARLVGGWMTIHPDSPADAATPANTYSFSQRFAGLKARKAIGFIQGIEPGLYFKK
jgi:hypothetical protein